jgi:hypothetical protein
MEVDQFQPAEWISSRCRYHAPRLVGDSRGEAILVIIAP